MEIKNFTLFIKDKCLFEDMNIKFEENKINHILGKNGTGKTCFSKAIIGAIKYKGEVKCNSNNICAIGSYTNLPLDLKAQDILQFVNKNFEKNIVDLLYSKLDIASIPVHNKIKNLSDGQRQKLKLLFFLSTRPQVIILDEFTNALDQKTCFDIYNFLNSYIQTENITIINITHNLTDLEYLNGMYYLIKDKKIVPIIEKENIIEYYIRG